MIYKWTISSNTLRFSLFPHLKKGDNSSNSTFDIIIIIIIFINIHYDIFFLKIKRCKIDAYLVLTHNITQYYILHITIYVYILHNIIWCIRGLSGKSPTIVNVTCISCMLIAWYGCNLAAKESGMEFAFMNNDEFTVLVMPPSRCHWMSICTVWLLH